MFGAFEKGRGTSCIIRNECTGDVILTERVSILSRTLSLYILRIFESHRPIFHQRRQDWEPHHLIATSLLPSLFLFLSLQ
jgi:hypothetical protein